MLRSELVARKRYDAGQIDDLVKVIFQNNEEAIFFDEFLKITESVTSELFVSIFDCIYQCCPLVKNFFIMRANYLHLL